MPSGRGLPKVTLAFWKSSENHNGVSWLRGKSHFTKARLAFQRWVRSPIDPSAPMTLEKGIGLAERFGAKETAMRRQRAGMRALDDQMMIASAKPAYTTGLLLRMAAPQDERRRQALPHHRRDAGIGNRIPSAPRMAARLARFDRQRVVEQQHALHGPARQVATNGSSDAQIGFDLLIDIAQARRQSHTFAHRERQAMRLSRPVIGVLPENHDPHLIKWCHRQRRQALSTRRVNRLARVLLRAQPPAQLASFRCLQRRFQRALPGFRDHFAHACGDTPGGQA